MNAILHSPRLRPLRKLAGVAVRATYRTPAPVVVGRWELPKLLNRRGLLGLAFEVGVRDGGFSEQLLSAWDGRLLVSIDPWAEPGEDELYELTRSRLAPHGQRSEIWRTTSVEAAARVQRASADFVYIDALHDYDSALEDVTHWYPKIRPGGIIAGHDYVDGEFPDGVFGVKRAVDEFFGARGLRARPTLLDPPWRSWMVRVPR
jgi:methyltransferase family protein